MVLNNDDYDLFVEELLNSFERNGITRRLGTTIIADAVHEMKKKKETTVTKGSEIKEITYTRTEQALYGPPPVREVVYESLDRQMLYGPPPVREVVEVHYHEKPQMLYGPPPVDIPDGIRVTKKNRELFGSRKNDDKKRK